MQPVFQMPLSRNLTIRNVSATKLGYNMMWTIIICKAVLYNYSTNQFSFFFFLIPIIRIIIHIKVLIRNGTHMNMAGLTIH